MTLPREWGRGPQWASASARAEWGPVLEAAKAAWAEVELASITEGLRGSALVYLAAAELPTAARDCAVAGLELSVLAAAGDKFRAAAHLPGLAAVWHQAWGEGDNERVGELLGYPRCCREFFARTWAAGHDVTQAMRTLAGPWEANTLLRPLGVRLVPHLPCSGDCAATVANARAYLAAAARLGASVDALEALLRLPVSYDAAAGVAVLTTPYFRFMVAAEPGTRQLRREGQVGAAWPRLPWADNGFASAAAMATAHAAVLAAVGRADSALDLGCGDGALLERLARAGGPGPWVGVEADEGRASRGNARRGGVVRLLHGLIEDPDLEGASGYDVALLMPGRLLEMDEEDAARVRAALPRVARRLVVYDYGGNVAGLVGPALAALAERAGVEVVGPVYDTGGAQAAEGRVA